MLVTPGSERVKNARVYQIGFAVPDFGSLKAGSREFSLRKERNVIWQFYKAELWRLWLKENSMTPRPCQTLVLAKLMI